jgi:hypothetical protein
MNFLVGSGPGTSIHLRMDVSDVLRAVESKTTLIDVDGNGLMPGAILKLPSAG